MTSRSDSSLSSLGTPLAAPDPNAPESSPDSDESPTWRVPPFIPSLAPLLQRILGASEPAFQATLASDVAQSDVALRRALFPVSSAYAYLNHAAVGPAPAAVVWATQQAFAALGVSGSLEMERRTPEDDVRQRFARLIAVAPEQIAFTKNVSDAFMTIAEGLDWRPGDNIVTPACEFPANVYPWLNLAERGVETRFVPLVEGRLPLDAFAERIDARTRLVSVSAVEFGSGLRNDVAAIARLAHAAGALCAVDGIQALGALRLDATAAELDFVCAGSAKWLLSPAHLGLLYVRPTALAALRVARRGWRSVVTPFDFFTYDQPLRADAGVLEGGSNNWLALVALGAALRLLESAGAEQIELRALALAEIVRAGLVERGFEVTSPAGQHERSQIITFRWREAQDDSVAAEVVARLASEAQAVISARNGLMRVSPHFYSTEGDIQRMFDGLDRLRRQTPSPA